MNRQELIDTLKLVPLENEGGFVREVYRGEMKDGRQTYSTILYLLTGECCSIMHRLDADEIWYHHEGPALEMLLIYEDHDEVVYLGKDLLHGERPQVRVPKGVWQGCRMAHEGEYTLVSTSMSPAYDEERFEAGSYDRLKEKTSHTDLLKAVSGRPVSK